MYTFHARPPLHEVFPIIVQSKRGLDVLVVRGGGWFCEDLFVVGMGSERFSARYFKLDRLIAEMDRLCWRMDRLWG